MATTVDNFRNSLIAKLLTIKDQDVLTAIDNLIRKSGSDQKVELTEEQKLMLKMSHDDMKNGRVVSQENLFEREREWLNGQ